MFKLKPNFRPDDVFFYDPLTAKSTLVAKTEMERQLIKSRYGSPNVQKFIQEATLSKSFKIKQSQSHNEFSISSYDIIYYKFALTKECVDFTTQFIRDSTQILTKKFENKEEEKKEFNKFKHQYGNFHITQASIGGKIMVEETVGDYTKFKGKAVEVIGGDALQATNPNVTNWKDSLRNPKTWKVAEVEKVATWDNWLYLELGKDSYLPSTFYDSASDGGYIGTIFNNQGCSISIYQNGNKVGDLCNVKNNLVIVRDGMFAIGEKFKFFQTDVKDYCYIYIPPRDDDDDDQKNHQTQWLNVNQQGSLVCEGGSGSEAGLFSLNKISDDLYTIQYAKKLKFQVENDDSSNSGEKYDIKDFVVTSTSEGESNLLLSCIDTESLKDASIVVFALKFSEQNERGFGGNNGSDDDEPH